MSLQFSGKKGLIFGITLLLIEYLLHALFYSYGNPELWDNEIPHKYIAYINLILFLIVLGVFVFGKRNEGVSSYEKLSTKYLGTIALGMGLCFFSYGTFIVESIIKANVFNEMSSAAFVDHNLRVRSALNLWNLLNLISYSIITSAVYQVFLLNGVAYYTGISKANIVVSLFYGFWFGDIIGGAVYCLFLNSVYCSSKNILIPILLSVIYGLVFSMAYFIKPDIWMLEAVKPDYNGEIIKGILLVLAFAPLAWGVFKKRI